MVLIAGIEVLHDIEVTRKMFWWLGFMDIVGEKTRLAQNRTIQCLML
jgi:hypothetical protein